MAFAPQDPTRAALIAAYQKAQATPETATNGSYKIPDEAVATRTTPAAPADQSSAAAPAAPTSTDPYTYGGDWNFAAMRDQANAVRGRPMTNQDEGYWTAVRDRNPDKSPNDIFQYMIGKGAAGADAATVGPYSADQGYVYHPTPEDLGYRPSSGASPNLFGGLANAQGASGINLGIGQSLVPMDADLYQSLLGKIKDILGGDSAFTRDALINLTSGRGAQGNTSAPSSASTASPGAVPAAATSVPAAATSTTPATPTVPPVTPTGPETPPPGPENPYAPDNGANAGVAQASDRNSVFAGSRGTPTKVSDRVGDIMAGAFGLTPVLSAANALSKNQRELQGDQVNVGPTDPNLAPTTPEQQQQNFDVASKALASNEGGTRGVKPYTPVQYVYNPKTQRFEAQSTGGTEYPEGTQPGS